MSNIYCTCNIEGELDRPRSDRQTSIVAAKPSNAAIPVLPPDEVWPIPNLPGSSLMSGVTAWTSAKKFLQSKGDGSISRRP